MKEKRIAIQLFGHLRTYKDCYKSLLEKVVKSNEKNAYKVDIFIHSWNTLNQNNNRSGYSNNDLLKKFGESKTGEVLELYKAKKVLIEEQKVIESQKVKVLLNEKQGDIFFLDSKNIYNMYYSMFKVNELRLEYEKENNIEYDFVIQTRPDILFIKDFNIDKIVKFSKDRRYISRHLKNITYENDDFPVFIGFWAEFPYIASVEPAGVWANDLLAFSSPKIMNKLDSLAPRFEEEINKPFWNHETFWTNWISQNNIEIQLLPYMFGREFEIKLFNSNSKVKSFFVKLWAFLKYIFYNVLCFLTLFLVKRFKDKMVKYANKL